MLDKLWDDVVAGPQPERGLERLRKKMTINTKDLEGGEGSSSMRGSQPGTPTTPKTPTSARKVETVWRSVFHPGSNFATKTIGADVFDKPLPNSPTVYDWLYSEESRSKHR